MKQSFLPLSIAHGLDWLLSTEHGVIDFLSSYITIKYTALFSQIDFTLLPLSFSMRIRCFLQRSKKALIFMVEYLKTNETNGLGGLFPYN
jgi:hypothetical protein